MNEIKFRSDNVFFGVSHLIDSINNSTHALINIIENEKGAVMEELSTSICNDLKLKKDIRHKIEVSEAFLSNIKRKLIKND